MPIYLLLPTACVPRQMDHHCKRSCNKCVHVDMNDLIADVDVDPEDGSISLAEITKRLHDLDEQSDLKLWVRYEKPLSKKEVADYADPEGSRGRETYDAFRALDTNADGFLDRNETRGERDVEMVLAADRSLLKTEAELASVQVKEENDVRMNLADTDRDSRLSLAEYVVYKFGAHRLGAKADKEIRALGKKHRAERRVLEAKRILARMDRNADKVIDQDELSTVIEFQQVGSKSTAIQAHTLLADVTHPDGVPIANSSKDEL